MKNSSSHFSRIPSRTRKAAQDTVDGCREYAAADLARASLMDTENGRRRLETSALTWSNRAQLIQRLDDSFEARRVVARAEWQEGEAASRMRKDPDASAAS